MQGDQALQRVMAKGLFECLHEANLGQYIEQFRLHGVKTLESLATLTIQDYLKFGIDSAQDRKRLFRLIHIVKGVLEERKINSSSFAMDVSVHNKENTPVRKTAQSRNKSLKDEGSPFPSSVKIQWTPRKKGAQSDSQELITTNNEHLQYYGSSLDTVQSDTLKRLENQGGILFINSSPNQSKVSPRNRTHELRQSLSDSEIVDDNPPDLSTNPADISSFGAPKLKESVVEVIDYKEKGYNYGIPGQKINTPIRKKLISAPSPHLDTSKIKVCVRKRPLLKKEWKAGEKDIVGTEDQSTVVLNEDKVAVDLTEFKQVHKYHFDEVFDEDCSNLEVYNKTAKLLVPSIFKRCKATCFAYGQTGAGKTHTMLGNKDTKGLYLLAAEDIFAKVDEEKAARGLSVWVGYFEIYCGQLFDLLNGRERLHAREDSRHNVCIAGLNEVCVCGPQGLIRVVEQGNKLRSTGSSGVNSDSSRSHAILQIELQDAGRRKYGRFSFIDLAGSERACDNGDPNKVTRFEGAEINTSLLALKECIRALDQDHRHTPFRQSKLTQVLKDSFVGQSRTCMIANIVPGASSSEHTLNTLRYADRVKELRKQTPVGHSPSSHHPPTPSTFSPGNTSTPVKPVKQPLTTRQLASTSTPIRTKTPGGHVDNQKQSLPTWKRRGSRDKSSLRKTPSGSPKSRPKSDRKNEGKGSRRSSTSSVKDEIKPGSTRRHQGTPNRNQRISSERHKDTSAKKIEDTPSKRTVEAKIKARKAFLLNNSLPVWEPTENMEIIKKEVQATPPAWEFDNPKFVKKTNLDSSKDETHDTSDFVHEPTDPRSGVLKSEGKVENYNNNSVNDRNRVHLIEEQKNEYNNINSEEVKPADNSFNSDSTIELLAEIDHALRNSMVSPLLDEIPENGYQKVETIPQDQHSRNIVGKYEICSSGVKVHSTSHPLTGVNWHKADTPQKTPVAVVMGVKSPDTSNKSLQHNHQSMPSQVNPASQDQIHLEMHYSKSPALRSRLSSHGIETLPSHQDSPRSRNTGDKEKARLYDQSMMKTESGTGHDKSRSESGIGHNRSKSESGIGHDRFYTASERDNSSGVIVSTSFAEYLTSHGINIPDVVVSPDKKSPPRNERTDLSYEADVSSMYYVDSKSQRFDGGDPRYSESRDIQNFPQQIVEKHNNGTNNTPSLEKHNQSNVPVQYTIPRNSGDMKSRVNVRPSSPGSGKTVKSDSSGHIIEQGPIGRPTPIGQTNEVSSHSAKQTAIKAVPMHQPIPRLPRTDQSQSQSVLSSTHQEIGTPVAQVVQPNQHSIPRAFTKESLGRSGVYLSYQMPPVQSPIMKETLQNLSVSQGSFSSNNQGSSYPVQDVKRSSNQGSFQQDRSSGGAGDSVKDIPSLKINLAGTEAQLEEVSTTLKLARDRLSGRGRHHSAISRAKDLLLSAHAEQVGELQNLCEKEMMLIAEVKTGEKDLPEYLDFVEDLLRSKLRCIDTFRDQLDSFAAHTPSASPRSSLD